MNTLLRGMVRAVAETFDLPGPILEVGSYQVENQEDVADLRSLFPGKPYVGLDMRTGPGVDVVGEVEALPQADASVGTVLALESFEHVRRFWKGFDEVRRVLRPDGALLVAVPFYFHILLSPRLLALHTGCVQAAARGLSEQNHRLARPGDAAG